MGDEIHTQNFTCFFCSQDLGKRALLPCLEILPDTFLIPSSCPRRGSPTFRRRRTRREFSPLRPPQSSPAWFTHAFAVLIYEFCLIDWVSSSWFTPSLLLFALQQFAFLSPQVVNIGNPHKNLACIISVECIKSFWCGLLFDLWKIRWIRLWQ